MDYKMRPYIVYIKTDDLNRVTAINSSSFLIDTDGWIEIDSGYGDKYHHAQGNYLNKSIMDERGIWRYKLVGVKPVERTQEELDADYVPPEVTPTQEERIAALEQQNVLLSEQLNAAKILLGLEE